MNYYHYYQYVCQAEIGRNRWHFSFQKFTLRMILFFAGVSRARHIRGSSSRTNCSGGISYLIFHFGIIHCHYCCSLSSVLFVLLSTTYFIYCIVRSMMKVRAIPRETVRGSERVRYARIVTNHCPARCESTRWFSRILHPVHCLYCILFVRHTYQRRRKFLSAEWKMNLRIIVRSYCTLDCRLTVV